MNATRIHIPAFSDLTAATSLSKLTPTTCQSYITSEPVSFARLKYQKVVKTTGNCTHSCQIIWYSEPHYCLILTRVSSVHSAAKTQQHRSHHFRSSWYIAKHLICWFSYDQGGTLISFGQLIFKCHLTCQQIWHPCFWWLGSNEQTLVWLMARAIGQTPRDRHRRDTFPQCNTSDQCVKYW